MRTKPNNKNNFQSVLDVNDQTKAVSVTIEYHPLF
jgi:hypothetical protein